MSALVAWAFAIAAVVSWSASLAVLGAARVMGLFAARVHPRTRARVWLFVTLLPAFVALLVLAAVLAPPSWFGLGDHCAIHDDHHLHLCAQHGAPWPPVIATVLAALFAARVLGLFAQRVVETVRAWRALRRLSGATTDALRLPLPGKIALTAGWLMPRVYATAAVADDPSWSAVLAHEHDHARHRDPLARLIARFALAVHAPGVASWIDGQLVAAQELAADEAAANAIEDRLEVARQLVTWARELHRSAVPLGATSFEHGDVEGRVRTLLMGSPRYVRAPLATLAITTASIAALAAALFAPHVHHAVETLLGALGA